MLRRLLGIDDAQAIDHVALLLRGGAWWLLGLCLLGVAAYAAFLYRMQRGLTWWPRVLLGVVRAVLLGLIVLVLFEPTLAVELTKKVQGRVLVLLDTSQSMAIADPRTTPEARQEAADVLGSDLPSPSSGRGAGGSDLPSPFLGRGAGGEGSTSSSSDSANPAEDQTQTKSPHPSPLPKKGEGAGTPDPRRIDLARAALRRAEQEKGALQALAKTHRIHLYTFGTELRAMAAGEGGEGDKPGERGVVDLTALLAAEPDGLESRLGSAVSDAASQQSDVSAVIVLTDGGSNAGTDPTVAAALLADRGVPIYAVTVGLPAPADVRVASVVAPETAFISDRVPVRVQIDSTGFDAATAKLTVTANGETIDEREVTLTGGVQFEDVMYEPGDRAGTTSLEASLEPLTGETLNENNTAAASIRVLDEKIKVLYAEGKPRWEFRYLRAVLERDPRLDVKLLMTRGDPDLASHDDRYIAQLPDEASAAFEYDLVILGDVPAGTFTPSQLERVDQLVRERGGSLLMLAGRYSPSSYRNTPIAELLPVRIGDAAAGGGGGLRVGDDVHPVVTAAGEQSASMRLVDVPGANAELWSLVRPMYRVPAVSGAKPGATVLAELSRPPVGWQSEGSVEDGFPLIAWQRTGSGKAMYVGTDWLWRLRLERGDTYHARFWQQTIQFLALSRLLGGNRRIHIETPRRAYSTGERVEVYANVMNEAYEPVTVPRYEVMVETVGGADGGERQAMVLEPVPGQPGLYSGGFTPEREGRLVIHAPQGVRGVASEAEVEVRSSPLEMRNPAADLQTLHTLAAGTGGQVLSLTGLDRLPDLIPEGGRLVQERTTRELFDLPAVFVLALLLAGVEWFARRRMNLV